MTSKVLWIAVLMLAAGGMLSPYAAHGAVIITYNQVETYLYNPSGGDAGDSFAGTSFPTNELVNATAGNFYSRIQADYTQSGGGETLSHDFFQKRDGDYYDYANGAESSMLFTVTADTNYILTGYYDVTDVTFGKSGYVYFYTYLVDVDTNTFLAGYAQESLNTTDEFFVLGGSGGDTSNFVFGSLTGNLLAGHNYQWHAQAYVQAYPDADDGASAVGNFSLVLGSGGSATVPEPASLAIWGLGAIGMMFVRRKRVSRRSWQRKRSRTTTKRTPEPCLAAAQSFKVVLNDGARFGDTSLTC